MRRAYRGDADEAGSTEVVGIVLLVGLVAIGTVGVLAVAQPAQEDTTDRMRFHHAETAFEELSERSRSVANGVGASDDVDLGFRGLGRESSLSIPDEGRIVATTQDGSEILNRSLGAVEYRADEGTLAYQGGGVWRGTGAESRMVSPPQLDYRLGTVSLDFLAVDGVGELGSSALEIGERPSALETRTTLFTDRNEAVRITVYSDYYAGWAEFFRDTFERAYVVVDEDEQRVSVVLGRYGGEFTVDNVITAYGGDAFIGNGAAEVYGDVAVDGDLEYGNGNSWTHSGTEATTSDDRNLNQFIRNAIARAEDEGVQGLGNDTLIDQDRYLVDGDLTLDSNADELTVDLSNGNVTLIVDGNVTIRQGGRLQVENASGDARLRILTSGNLAMKGGQAIVGTRSDLSAEHLRVYGTSTMEVGIVSGTGGGNGNTGNAGQTYFEGFVYAPRETPTGGENPAILVSSSVCDLNGNESDVCIANSNAVVEGAIHAGPASVTQSAVVRYDPDLSSIRIRIPMNVAGVAPLDHLNLAVRELLVEQD